MTYALDTNIIIHLMRGTHSVLANREHAKRNNARFVIPPIVNYEIQRRFIIKPTKNAEIYKGLCTICDVGEMTQLIWICAAQIYADLHACSYTVSDADILIAAFCITNGYTLVTNDQHFRYINDLNHVDWVQ